MAVVGASIASGLGASAGALGAAAPAAATGISAGGFAAMILATSAVSAAGQLMSSSAQSKVEEGNIDIIRQEQEMVDAQKNLDIYGQRKEATTFKSHQAALTAKSGVQFTGSPLEVLESTAASFELDILKTEYNAAMKRSRLESEAIEQKAKARATRATGYARAGTTLLSSAGTAANKFFTP